MTKKVTFYPWSAVERSSAYILLLLAFLKVTLVIKNFPFCDGRISRNCVSRLSSFPVTLRWEGWGTWMGLVSHLKHCCFCFLVCNFRSMFRINRNSWSIWSLQQIWCPGSSQCSLRMWTWRTQSVLHRELVLQIISSSADCFFNKNIQKWSL